MVIIDWYGKEKLLATESFQDRDFRLTIFSSNCYHLEKKHLYLMRDRDYDIKFRRMQ